jgi:hypothetical protein
VFTSKQTMLAREVSSAHAQLDRLLASRDSWYDGTIASIDRRLAAVTNALPLVARAADHDEEMFIECERLRHERLALQELRVAALQDSTMRRKLPRKADVGDLTVEARRFIATELRHFLADNADVIDNPDELDERAQNYAELATVQMPVTSARSVIGHFRMAVNWASKPKPKPQPVREASVDHFPDEMLFY